VRSRKEGGEAMSDYPKIRDLDGVYFRVERGGRYKAICWSDLTDEEREQMGDGMPTEWWRSMALIMTRQLRHIGDELGIVFESDEED